MKDGVRTTDDFHHIGNVPVDIDHMLAWYEGGRVSWSAGSEKPLLGRPCPRIRKATESSRGYPCE
ncbi:hypothetical protein PENSUB_11022 [Penicillium subrubescens]|uniref:Uncharacterized protein n=1 Tax=Penicillium subrubescens TaxID=1316194 RepID=A0A1Q5T5L7_9EURO|nr:hypothetical protein PENSUB_11022 [Penicillium subrubescens]